MYYPTHCNTLQRTTTHCNTLQHTATHCNTLQHTVTHCSALQSTAAHYNTLQHTATHCNTLQRTAAHYKALQRTTTHDTHAQHQERLCRAIENCMATTHCSSLQLSVTHCNTLQHTATHCNTLQHTGAMPTHEVCITDCNTLNLIYLGNTQTHAQTHIRTHTHIRTQTHTHTHTHIFKTFGMNSVSQPPTVIHRKNEYTATLCNTLKHSATHHTMVPCKRIKCASQIIQSHLIQNKHTHTTTHTYKSGSFLKTEDHY